MEAIKLLKQDHEEVKKIMEKLDSTTERGVKTREQLFTKLKSEMQVHETIEEEIFYPSRCSKPPARCSASPSWRTWAPAWRIARVR